MKQNWARNELEHYWTLSSYELNLLKHKSTKRRLSFAFMLKFYQYSKRFPDSENIPLPIISHIAFQINIPETVFRVQHFSDDTGRQHRNEICELLGIRKNCSSDAKSLMKRLAINIIPEGNWSKSYLCSACYDYFEERKIEPFSTVRLERNINKAIAIFEENLFNKITLALAEKSKELLDKLLEESPSDVAVKLNDIKNESNALNLESILTEVEKLNYLKSIDLPVELLSKISFRIVQKYYMRIAAEPPNEIRAHNETTRYAMLTFFCYMRNRKITDNLIELFIQVIHKFERKAANSVDKEILKDVKKVKDKSTLLYLLCKASHERPNDAVKDAIYPLIGEEALLGIIREYKQKGSYKKQVQTKIRFSYMRHYRRMLSPILNILTFNSTNSEYDYVIDALNVIKEHLEAKFVFFPENIDIPLTGIAEDKYWENFMLDNESQDDSDRRIRRINYEMTVLHTLRERLRCKAVWVEGADEYRNPDEDLPCDFEAKREYYYKVLDKPLNADEFISGLKDTMHRELSILNEGMPLNKNVKILKKSIAI